MVRQLLHRVDYDARVRIRTLAGAAVTQLGTGDVSLATSAARNLDAREVERALHEALQLGVTLVDVRDEPDAERLVGDAVRALRLRDTVTIATRVPLVAERPGAPRRDVLPERLPARYVQDKIEDALRATRVDALPLAQLSLRPAWRASPAWPELLGTCARLVREGKVMAWGALLDDVGADLDGAAALVTEEPAWLAAVSVPYSLCDRAAEPLLDAIATASAERPIAVLARHPLAGGALAGVLGPGVSLPRTDDRRALDAATLERIAVEVARLAPLVRATPPAATSCDAARAVLERGRRPEHVECATLAELALRFVIDRGAIALPRLHRRDHLAGAIVAAAAPPLSAALVARIREENPDRGR